MKEEIVDVFLEREPAENLFRVDGKEAAEIIHLNPIWVECTKCLKWRLLPDCFDPTTVAENWHCAMNTGLK